jgi:signal transduction histidine kinase
MVFVAYGGTLLSRYRESERARREAVEREADLRRSMLRDIEEQQRHFGRELHDGVCQLLSGTSLAIESLASRLESKLPAEATAVREIEGFIRKALAEGRDLAHGAFPVQMGSEGLPVALAELASMGDRMAEGVRVTFSQRGPTETVSPEIAMHLYRIAQEAMGNALRHAGARNVNIVLSSDARGLSVEVADDGSGIGSGSKSGPGIGLRTMAYRAAQIGARLEFLTRDRGGTRVICLLSKADGDTKRDTPPAS